MLTPLELSSATRVSEGLWRKQVLPEGKINYKGREVEFTPAKLQAMVSSFRAHAFDSVPLVMADSDNKHTMDPRNATGRVVDVEYRPGHGLDLLVAPDEEARNFLAKNKDVGVSARIVEHYDRADGQYFEAAMQHALITFDPRIPGLAPWESVELSNEDGDLLDLSIYQFGAPGVGEEETTMSDELTKLSAEEIADLKALLAVVKEAEAEDGTGTEDKDDDEISDAELERLAASLLEADDDEDDDLVEDDTDAEDKAGDKELVTTHSNEGGEALELANARLNEQGEEIRRMADKLAEKDFLEEIRTFANDYGIPPAITKKAEPLLKGSHVMELSNGTSVDAGQVMRDVLKAVGETGKMLDLSGQLGREADFGTEEGSKEEMAARAATDRKALGI